MLAQKSKVNSLHYADLDDVEMIMDLERSFKIKFSDASLERCQNVGELFQYFKQLYPPDKTTGKCTSSMAFYRLRRTFKAIGITVPITPKTPMNTLSELPPYELEKSVNKQMKNFNVSLAMPSRCGNFGADCMAFGTFFAVLSGCFWWKGSANGSYWLTLSLLVILLGVVLYQIDLGKYKGKTVRDCAEDFACANFFLLEEEGGDMREATLWKVFCWFLTQHSDADIDPREITMETMLFD